MKRLLIAILLLFSGSGWAACTVSTVNASFGSVTSFALSSTGEVQTTGTLVVSCDTVLQPANQRLGDADLHLGVDSRQQPRHHETYR